MPEALSNVLSAVNWTLVADWFVWLAPIAVAFFTARGWSRSARVARAIVVGVEQGTDAWERDEQASSKAVKQAVAAEAERTGVSAPLDALVQRLTHRRPQES